MRNEPAAGRGATESGRRAATPARGVTLVAFALQAAVAAERTCARAIWAPEIELAAATPHAFGAAVQLLGSSIDDARGALAACEAAAADGLRAAAFVSASSLSDARRALAELVERRRAVVVHVIVSPEGREASAASYADVHALTDLGVGVLLVRDAQDAADLVLVAHRAAEDAEAPVLVVHDGYPSSHARDRVLLADGPLVRALLDAEPAKHPVESERVLPHRRAGQRMPFAISSAMRAFERHAGRGLDLIDAFVPLGAEIAIVAGGAIAETARAVVEHLASHEPPLEIGLVQLVSLRPFPGPQLVKALSRARAVVVLERIDAPLAQSNPLAVEVKAAFADALTWTPGYPGIGRIPNVYAGSIDPAAREATPGAIVAVVENVLLGEQGRRAFHIGDAPHPTSLPVAADRHLLPDGAFALREHGDPALLCQVLADLYGAHVRATPRRLDDHGDVFDLVVSPAPVRAHHGASELDLVLLDEQPSAIDRQALELLREGGAVVIATDARDASVFALLPVEVRDAIRARDARVFLAPRSSGGARASVRLAAILRANPPADREPRAVLADVERSLHGVSPRLGDDELRAVLAAVANALEAIVELPAAPPA